MILKQQVLNKVLLKGCCTLEDLQLMNDFKTVGQI